MAQAANIVIADALATPVNHTFVPVGVDPKDPARFWFEDQSQSSAIGFWRVSIKLVRPSNSKSGDQSNGRTSRCTIELHEPVLETLSNSSSGMIPAPTVAYVSRSITEFVLPERSSLQNRRDIRKMHQLLLADVQVIAAVENLLSIY